MNLAFQINFVFPNSSPVFWFFLMFFFFIIIFESSYFFWCSLVFRVFPTGICSYLYLRTLLPSARACPLVKQINPGMFMSEGTPAVSSRGTFSAVLGKGGAWLLEGGQQRSWWVQVPAVPLRLENWETQQSRTIFCLSNSSRVQEAEISFRLHSYFTLQSTN